MASSQAWVTLVTNDSYALGALVLAHSLRRSGTTRNIVVMVTSGVSSAMLSQLNDVFTEVVNVSLLDSGDVANLGLLERPELGITFTKLHCWKLTQYTKCVFLDADTLVVRNSDDLFDREEFSAAPDAGWPDCFNSGVFVYVPSEATFRALLEFAAEHGSFDGGDQGLLNMYFSDWSTKDIKHHLPFLYNVVATATYTYLPAYKHFGDQVKIVHFIGASKPWNAMFDESGQPVPRQSTDRHAIEHLKSWWDIFRHCVKTSKEADTTTGYHEPPSTPSTQTELGEHQQPFFQAQAATVEQTPEQRGMEEAMSKLAWEQGHPDIHGSASMENILKKIDKTVSSDSPK